MTPFDRKEAIERFLGKCLNLSAHEFCSDPEDAAIAAWVAFNEFNIFAPFARWMTPWVSPLETSEKVAKELSALDWPALADDAEFQGLLEYMRETLK